MLKCRPKFCKNVDPNVDPSVDPLLFCIKIWNKNGSQVASLHLTPVTRRQSLKSIQIDHLLNVIQIPLKHRSADHS